MALRYQGLLAWIHKHATALFRADIGFQLLAVVLTGALLIFGVAASLNLDVGQCQRVDHGTGLAKGLILAVAALVGAGAGRLLARVRFEIRRELQGPPVRSAPIPWWIHGVAFAFLVVAAGLLGYETWAVLNFGHPPPITSYVRCAAFHHTVVAPLTAGGVGLLLGSWLWYPTR